MIESIQSFIGWYLAPWRRIGRKEFGVALTVASLPGLLFMVMGFGDGMGSFFQPLLDLMNGAGDAASLEKTLTSLQNGVSGGTGGNSVAGAAPFDWEGFVNGLLFLGLVPLCRMRLRDMGWFGWQEIFLTVVFNVSIVEGLVQILSGYDILPWGTLWGLMNFGGYLWLTFAKGKPRVPMHERIPAAGGYTDDEGKGF